MTARPDIARAPVRANPLRATLVRAVLGAAALALCAGCIFAPRDPEPPATGAPVTLLPQTSSANVWANLERSLNAGYAPGWEDNISQEAFVYEADSAAESQFPGIFAAWGRDQETAFINNLFNSGVTIHSLMKDDGFTPPPDGGVETVWEGVIYDVTLTDPTDNSTTRYRASAIITFSLEGNFWYITRWRDQQGESDPDNPGTILPSMGVLRGTFASK